MYSDLVFSLCGGDFMVSVRSLGLIFGRDYWVALLGKVYVYVFYF